jgi:hypothetical protein
VLDPLQFARIERAKGLLLVNCNYALPSVREKHCSMPDVPVTK